jgi:DNA-directed RNA polymerase specialized sigma24 family protein
VAIAEVGDEDLAYEAVQDAFANALARRDTSRGGDANLAAWVSKIVVNAARVARRSSYRQADRPVANGAAHGEPDRSLRTALAALPSASAWSSFFGTTRISTT